MSTRDLLGMLAQAQGGQAIGNIASRFGLSETQAQSAVQALLPALSAGVRRESSAGGLDTLLQGLQPATAQRALEDSSALEDSATVEQGNALLGQLFGSRDVSRRVAADASDRTGVDAGVLRQLLPLVATMLVGGAAQNAAPQAAAPQVSPGGGMFGQLLGAVAGGSLGSGSASAGAGGLGGMFGALTGALDDEGDGVADDILDMINQRGR
ncbi:DUF937 domain-containing protein [Maricaulis sp.]|uniref:DUF937 domain-containing protein n=1 Tax=Maricaulis sp. TaxID=1486257 RepID=UPI003A93568E